MLQAVLFDLDGTLLPMDTQEFMKHYLNGIGAAAAPVTDPMHFIRCLMASTQLMLTNRDPRLTNFDIFWTDFRSRLKDCMDTLEPLIQKFYDEKFRELRKVALTSTHSRKAVQAALNRDLRIVLATNPVFPLQAIRERMTWAGIDDLPWDLVTSYEEMHFCKPHLEYYQEIAERIDVQPGECLMVGNDIGEDLVAANLGMRTCLVTDYLVNPGKKESLKPEWSGPLAELPGWLAQVE